MTSTKLFLTATAAAAAANALAASNSSGFEPGVDWQICIHQPIKHDSADDFIPENAKIFDIDLAHAQEYPQMVPRLHVCPSSTCATLNQRLWATCLYGIWELTWLLS